jgi:hypothetical protein
MPFPKDDAVAEEEVVNDTSSVTDNTGMETETPEVSTTSTFDSSSPYVNELKGLLTQYQGALSKRSTERTKVLAEAQRRLLARAEDPMGQAAALFRMSAAFGKPTRTGGFGETLSNVGEAIAPELEKMQARKEALFSAKV